MGAAGRPALPIPLGKRYGRLVVIGRGQTRVNNKPTWECLCDCGNRKDIRGTQLQRGTTVTCGCREGRARVDPPGWPRREDHALYTTWRGMRERCQYLKHVAYDRYGGRGIRVCERWDGDFRAFVEDMGPKPTAQHSIDRIDPDGNYEPSNCRWATASEQNSNKRRT
jgi:hypothetical protein